MRKTFLEKCINLRLCRVALVLLFLVPAISSLQANPSQNKTISGVVTSATDSEPLIGVSVQVRETATGGITDIDGRYSVSAQQGQTLVFSYIGYQSQEIKVGTSSVINVVLKEDTEMLDEVIVLGLLSNAIGDGGYIILLPIAAMLFQWVGLHPIAGIVTAYVSVACGYSANIVLSTMDPLLAHTTQEAALAQTGYQGNTEPLCNYFFMSASTVAITAIVYWITQKWLLPTLGKYEGSMKVVAYHPLSRKERRAIMISIVVAAIYVALILWLTFSSYGILRGVNGGLMHSPFIAGILFLLSLGAGITGMAYGFSSGRYRTDNDVIEGLTQPMKLLGVYFVIAFFAAQMFACFEYSHLDKCLAIMGADLLSSFEPAPLSALVLFILFTALINLIMVSATSKWAFMSFIFIPMFAQMGIAPDIAQCAFRIGDSSTNAITPFLFYMPLVLTYMRQYDKQITYGSLLKYTWRYSLGILVVWTLLFIVWYLLKIPMGL